MTVNNEPRGWVFYDADCALCIRLARRAARILEKRGFRLLPLQTAGTSRRLGVSDAQLLAEMHLLTHAGIRLGGADALIEIARHVWWARPLSVLARLPGAMQVLRFLYARIAANRYCVGGACGVPRRPFAGGGLPLLVFPTLALAFRNELNGWVFMWVMALALYAGCKWLTYRNAVARGTQFEPYLALAYLFGWVGMEPGAFAEQNSPAEKVPGKEWLAAFSRVVVGMALVWGGVRAITATAPLAAGWLGMLGVILLLHFGLFQLLALTWRQAGAPVKPLMRAPLLATSLGDFWGARWNTGFHALAHEFVFRLLHRRIGRTLAVLAVFLASGLVHELVITLPARGGYGLPTAYFLLQGLGLVMERSPLGKKLALGAGVRGRVFALLVAAAPAFWLFPPIFIRQVILPMLHALGAT